MKFDNQKAFPYPVLRPFSDDYLTSEFQASIDITTGEGKSDIEISAGFITSCNEIVERIESGDAKYALVISCRESYLRDVVKSDSAKIVATYPGGSFKGEIEIQPFVTVEKGIADFVADDINPEFGHGPFSFQHGQILAMDETHVFYIDRDLFRPITSVFELVKDDSHAGSTWMVRLEEDHVQIVLSPPMKELLDDARNTTANKAILINSVYFGAVAHAIQAVKDSNEYSGYRWAEVLERQCHNQGIDIGVHPAYETAQILMREPLALLQRYVFEGSGE